MNERLEDTPSARFKQWSKLIEEGKTDIVKDELLTCGFQIRGSTDDIWIVLNGDTKGKVVLLGTSEEKERLARQVEEIKKNLKLKTKLQDDFVIIKQQSWFNSDTA